LYELLLYVAGTCQDDAEDCCSYPTLPARTLDVGVSVDGATSSGGRRLLSEGFTEAILAREQFFMDMGSQLGLGADLESLELGPIDARLSQGDAIIKHGTKPKLNLVCVQCPAAMSLDQAVSLASFIPICHCASGQNQRFRMSSYSAGGMWS
jgi:hypothetical protein